MYKISFTFLLVLSFFISNAQRPTSEKDSTTIANDSIRKSEFLTQIGNGYFPTKYFNLDLRYLIKFNQYEGLRTGLGGITNENFSKKMRINSYLVYGFRDHTFKYGIGSGFKISSKTNTWINLTYTDDLQETGSTQFLTDKRFFQFFEPRLLNIDLFHKHITSAISLEHEILPNLYSESQLMVSNINPTYDYEYVINNEVFKAFNLSMAKISLQWNPFSKERKNEDGVVEMKEGFPKFTFQYSRNFKDILKSEFNFSKIDFRTYYKLPYEKDSYSEITLTAGIAKGHAPLTHLYHAYPNNITKETILQRFSVAGITSFETMYFNEFFSDRFTTIQFKHYLNPFKFGVRFKPQLVLISRFALGDMDNIQRHQNVTFNTLHKGYTESGFEINKLLFGFGLSCTYRYGAYHLPKLEDNFALKFTFYVTL